MKWVKAFKPHICDKCNRTIQPGESYCCIKAFNRREIITIRTCKDCMKGVNHEHSDQG